MTGSVKRPLAKSLHLGRDEEGMLYLNLTQENGEHRAVTLTHRQVMQLLEWSCGLVLYRARLEI